MQLAKTLFATALLSTTANGVAITKESSSSSDTQKLANPQYGPIPGESHLYSSYRGKAPPFPANITDPILPTKKGKPATDDQVRQNLLSAEWVIFSFYQQGVESFNKTSFTDAGYPNTTYDRIQEIRDNEAGHLRIFQDKISETSLKPGACKYQFPFHDAVSFLALVTFIEISSMAFLTGLVQEAKLPASQDAMMAIAETESRHETWSLIDVWNANPFAGPSDTVFPYANQILDTTNVFIVNGSCPKENPTYPNPRQGLPLLQTIPIKKSVEPGSVVALNFTGTPNFKEDRQYYTTFFHGPWNITVPIETKEWPKKEIAVEIPSAFENRGIIIAVVTDTIGAPTLDSVVAGPAIILEQPAQLGAMVG
jgi:hypothetical protein